MAEVCEWFDDREGRFRIEVDVRNCTWGPLFGYSGWFDVDWIPMPPDQLPGHIFPHRVEARE